LNKVVITGSNGLLGQKLVKLLSSKDDFEVFALSKGKNRLLKPEGYAYYSIDLLDGEKLTALLDEILPHYIIHTAAMTNVDACELDKVTCDRMNVDMLKPLVSFCAITGAHLIHLSTDFIFDGLKGSVYTEADAPNPVNYYGLSKLKSEEMLANSKIDYSILRTILVYGLVDNNDRSNIVLWVKRSLEQGKHINVVTDQLRMPTYAEDLAEACWLIIAHKAKGIFNVSSSELMSIYEIALAVADAFDLDQDLIHPVETSVLGLPADRPLSTGFDLDKSANEINLPLYTFKERLQVFKNQLSKYK